MDFCSQSSTRSVVQVWPAYTCTCHTRNNWTEAPEVDNRAHKAFWRQYACNSEFCGCSSPIVACTLPKYFFSYVYWRRKKERIWTKSKFSRLVFSNLIEVSKTYRVNIAIEWLFVPGLSFLIPECRFLLCMLHNGYPEKNSVKHLSTNNSE